MEEKKLEVRSEKGEGKSEKGEVRSEKVKKDYHFLSTFINGLWKENPVFVIMLGMCPTLAVTTSFTNAVGMGVSTTCVLVFSNMIIASLRNIIPDRVRIPSYIVIVASLVTIVQLLMQAYFPSLYKALGIYIPLIVVNCIIFGRAESFASKNPVLTSAADGLGMGLGFTIAICIIGVIRELLGDGSILGNVVIPEDFTIKIFVLAPGAFLVLAMLIALQNKMRLVKGEKKEKVSCDFDCAHCSIHKKDKPAKETAKVEVTK